MYIMSSADILKYYIYNNSNKKEINNKDMFDILLNSYGSNFYDYIIDILRLNSYYNLEYLKNNNKKYNKELYERIKHTSFDDIIVEIEKNPGLIIDIIKNSLDFTSLPIIYKHNLFKEKNIKQISPLSKIDYMAYMPNYSLKDFINYYDDYVYKMSEKIVMTIEASNYILDLLNKLKNENILLFKQLLLELIKRFYLWGNYRKNKYNNLDKEENSIMHLIDIANNYYEVISEDSKLISNIVYNFLYYNSSAIGTDEIDNMNKYYSKKNKINENVKRKLGL